MKGGGLNEQARGEGVWLLAAAAYLFTGLALARRSLGPGPYDLYDHVLTACVVLLWLPFLLGHLLYRLFRVFVPK